MRPCELCIYRATFSAWRQDRHLVHRLDEVRPLFVTLADISAAFAWSRKLRLEKSPTEKSSSDCRSFFIGNNYTNRICRLPAFSSSLAQFSFGQPKPDIVAHERAAADQ